MDERTGVVGETGASAAAGEAAPQSVEVVSASIDGPNAIHFLKTGDVSDEEMDRMTHEIVAAIKTVFDPEIPADIYELGLIYTVDISQDGTVAVDMTLTAPGCPVAGEMPIWVQDAVAGVAGISDVKVNLVFDPPWTPERMSEEAQVAIGWFY